MPFNGLGGIGLSNVTVINGAGVGVGVGVGTGVGVGVGVGIGVGVGVGTGGGLSTHPIAVVPGVVVSSIATTGLH